MAGPQFVRSGARVQSAGAATLTPTKPAVDTASGLLVCVVFSKNNAVHSTATAGWAKLGQVNSGASFTASIFTAAESAAAPVITWTGSAACAAQVSYYSDPANTVDTTPGASASNAGLTATHSTSAVATTRANSLVIYVDAAAANTALGTPSGWTANIDNGSATDAGRTSFGSKSVASSGSSSGAISVTGANAAWVQWQIEIMGSAPGPLDFSKLELGAWFSPPINKVSYSKLELGAWYVPPNDQVSYSKLELGAWLIVGTILAPAAGSISLTGQTPSVTDAVTFSPGSGSIVFSAVMPVTRNNVSLAPSAGALVFSGLTPVATYSTTSVADEGFISIIW